VTVDVVVVGGGITGLVVARELRFAGFSCALIDARERLGGRVRSQLQFGAIRDVGATFVHWVQPHVWAEITRYRHPITTRPPVESTVALVGDRRIEGDLGSLWAFIGPGMDAFCADARRLFPFPYGDVGAEELAIPDQQSIADRISRLDVAEDARAIIDGFWAVNCNRPSSEGALTHALRLVAACGDWRVFNEACARFKLVDGLGALVRAIHDDASPELILGDPACSVEQDPREVVVRTAHGREVRARACVLALPFNVLGAIEVRPSLSSAKVEALRAGAPAGGFKLWVLTERRVPSSVLCMASGDSPLMFARTEDTLDDASVLGLYGADRTRLDLASREAVEHELRRWMPTVRVAEVWSHDWCADVWSRETWRVARPGQLTSAAAELRRKEARVVIAGADFAPGPWNGFVDGAVESAMTTVAELKLALSSGEI
jgi:monoamine oxidase